MLRNTASIVIDCRATAIFPYLIKPEHIEKWLGGLVNTEPLTEGGPRLGARSRETVEERGRQMVMETEIVRYEPPNRMQVRITADVFEGTGDYQLLEIDGQTRVIYEAETQFKGFIRFFEFIMKRGIQKKVKADLARLKAVVESEV